MGFLIVRVTPRNDPHEEIATFAARSALGEPRYSAVRTVARRNGYDIQSVLTTYQVGPEERAHWPLSIIAYTSRNREGVGRTGSSIQSYQARIIPCEKCHGRGDIGFLGGTLRFTMPKRCRACRGTGRSESDLGRVPVNLVRP
jgi:hypothetical protein